MLIHLSSLNKRVIYQHPESRDLKCINIKLSVIKYTSHFTQETLANHFITASENILSGQILYLLHEEFKTDFFLARK